MNNSIQFLIILICSLNFPFNGDATTIRCTNPEYANEQLIFYSFADPISNNNKVAFTLKFNNEGTSETSIQIDEPLFTFSEFGIYRGMLLLEPGKTVDLKLPPLKKKSFADQKNPYFKPISFWIFSNSGQMLNDKISRFEQKLNELTDKDFNALYFQQSKSAFNRLKTGIDEAFPETQSESFELHKKLRLKLIEADIFRLSPEDYSAIFQPIAPEFWEYESFKTLLDKTFDKQLSFSAKAIGGGRVSEAVARENIKDLLVFISEKYQITGKMADLVLLKMLHDGFYSKEFPEKAIKNMIADKHFTNHQEIKIRDAASNIATKITFLEKGSVAPAICLTDINSEKCCTNNSQEKFKYIIFADVETLICQEHLKYLSRVNELFSENLEIFVVLRDTERSGIDSFFTANKVPATILVDKENKTIAEYKIQSFPQCILLNEKHQVVFDDAKAPLNGFEQQFGKWLRNELFMRQRNQAR
ncbi:redoxin domain-containing protein [Draconibacterium halophilum]|uniref:Redoxin domain-containing protein n=1 Tax=Draconibacterium halophilum TaxID=2706887 RepID=A0A6C0RJH8_9BACT|nr:redoxin domain-containing protein [Draconibacterium halophilum]QIA09723.1 redoxin domain-containing protein [Draconibacterium halophilum]